MIQKNNYKANYPKNIALSAILILGLFTITLLACSSTSGNFNSDYNHASGLNLGSTALDTKTSERNNIIPAFEPMTEEVMESAEGSELIEAKDKNRKFNFHSKGVYWKGTIEDGKVATLYKDGDKVPADKIMEYEDFILNTIAELDEDMAQLEIDMDSFKENMKQLKVDLSNMQLDLNLEFLDDLKEHFDSDEFKEEMLELKHELSKIKDIDIDFDKESFKESMRELKETMKDFKIDMSDLDVDLSDLKIDLKELKVEMKKLKSFLNELRPDLVKEGYLQNEEEEFDLDLNKDTIEVNGKKLPVNLHKRYLKMYKDHFGKELEKDFTIHN